MNTEPAAPSPADEQRFETLWRDHAPRVQAYALRRVDRHTAQEIVAETFLVAWRRLADVPDEPLPWLLVTARNLISTIWRADSRHRALATELALIARRSPPGDLPGEREQMLRALASLSERDREAILLVAWDGLDPDQAAEVTGSRPASFRVRLHRARRRLAAAMADDAGAGPGAAAGWGVVAPPRAATAPAATATGPAPPPDAATPHDFLRSDA